MKEAKHFCEQNVLNIHPEYTDKKIKSRIKKKNINESHQYGKNY